MHKNQVDICLPQHRLNNFIEILGIHHSPQTQSRTSGKQQQKTVNLKFLFLLARDLPVTAAQPWFDDATFSAQPRSAATLELPPLVARAPHSSARIFCCRSTYFYIYIIVVFHTVVVSPPAAAARHRDQEMVSTVAIVGSFLTPAASGLLQINQNWRSTFIFRVFPIFLLNPFKLNYSLITHPL